MRLLFVKDGLAWPRSSGHDVHCFYMMQALTRLGHDVGLLTAAEPAPQAITGLPLALRFTFPPSGEHVIGPEPCLSRLQERFRSYWGIDPNRLRAVGRAAEEFGADAVVVVGLNVLLYLGAVHNRLRIWYAADEWAWHHLSQVRFLRPGTWGNLKQAIVKGLYERAFRGLLDRVWVVSEADRRAMSWVAGAGNVDVLPNGVDGSHYTPRPLPQDEYSCVFWGRLDFGPNIQALEWFCHKVWPELRQQVPPAQFTIYGFQPTPPVQALTRLPGVRLIPDLPDLRDEIAHSQVVVLPFVSGGGINNKLLEAASMGKAIVCSPRTSQGLRRVAGLPFLQASRPGEWIKAIRSLWSDPDRRQHLGAGARQWVLAAHSWEAAAQIAIEGLERSLGESNRR